ncbi:TPA: hypothetical protein REW11_005480 [Klebsiella pneumoniae]|nr:hypothetical protein [Klebsiella pneumoniae]
MKLILNPANRRGFAFLGETMQQPYFFNPGMTTQQLEDWLGQQKSKRRLSTVWQILIFLRG